MSCLWGVHLEPPALAWYVSAEWILLRAHFPPFYWKQKMKTIVFAASVLPQRCRLGFQNWRVVKFHGQARDPAVWSAGRDLSGTRYLLETGNLPSRLLHLQLGVTGGVTGLKYVVLCCHRPYWHNLITLLRHRRLSSNRFWPGEGQLCFSATVNNIFFLRDMVFWRFGQIEPHILCERRKGYFHFWEWK